MKTVQSVHSRRKKDEAHRNRFYLAISIGRQYVSLCVKNFKNESKTDDINGESK